MAYYKIPKTSHSRICDLYKQGYSAEEIHQELQLSVNTRSIQRLIKKMGIIRTVQDAYHNAMKRGRVQWCKKEEQNKVHRIRINRRLRYRILERDGFRCKLCGADASTSLLEIDHIDENPANNTPDNLRTLCYDCNVGRPSINHKWKYEQLSTSQPISMCKHNAQIGLCRFGCKA